MTEQPASVGQALHNHIPEEDPARIDRIRPLFFECGSVEAIDVQIQRARRQLGLWERRLQAMTELREHRIGQKERGEWPS